MLILNPIQPSPTFPLQISSARAPSLCLAIGRKGQQQPHREAAASPADTEKERNLLLYLLFLLSFLPPPSFRAFSIPPPTNLQTTTFSRAYPTLFIQALSLFVPLFSRSRSGAPTLTLPHTPLIPPLLEWIGSRRLASPCVRPCSLSLSARRQHHLLNTRTLIASITLVSRSLLPHTPILFYFSLVDFQKKKKKKQIKSNQSKSKRSVLSSLLCS